MIEEQVTELKTQQQEIVIEIYLKKLEMRVSEDTPVRVIWSRGKKQAKTQFKTLT